MPALDSKSGGLGSRTDMGSLCSVLWKNTRLPQFLSPPRNKNGYWLLSGKPDENLLDYKFTPGGLTWD